MKIGLHTIHKIHSVIRDLQGLGTSLFLCVSNYVLLFIIPDHQTIMTHV